MQDLEGDAEIGALLIQFFEGTLLWGSRIVYTIVYHRLSAEIKDPDPHLAAGFLKQEAHRRQ